MIPRLSLRKILQRVTLLNIMALVCPRHDGQGCPRLMGTDMGACNVPATRQLFKLESLLMDDAVEHCLSLYYCRANCLLNPPAAKDSRQGTVDSTVLGAVDHMPNVMIFGFGVRVLVEDRSHVATELGY